MPLPTRCLAALTVAWLSHPGLAFTQAATGETTVSIIYTGRSLGALGGLRSQDEHELITEQASAEGLTFKLVSHMAWRSPGIAVFLSTDSPEGDELPGLLAALPTAERFDSVRALRSGSVLLVQDPQRPEPDLLALLMRNPRRVAEFPDLVETRVTVRRLRAPRGERAYSVEDIGAEWPMDPAAWTTGEMNRINVGDSRVFELPLNIGEMGSRATLLRRITGEARATSAATVLADLGQRDGDLGVPRRERAGIDYSALARLEYSLAVPYEFELALGRDGLQELREEFPGIRFLASNVKAKDSTLLAQRFLLEAGGIKLGLLGLVSPQIRSGLPRDILNDFTIEPPAAAARQQAAALRLAGAEVVVALSNLDPADNAAIASQVTGIDAIVADLHARLSPEEVRTEVFLPDRPRSRPGSPALVARGFANGLGIGRLDLRFREQPGGGHYLIGLSHTLTSVTDRIAPDTAVVNQIRSMAQVARIPKGELMFPSFNELAARHPRLAEFDETTRQGRVSQRMWEEFVARLLRSGSRAEVAVIRKFPQFPPLIGKLHEDEIRAWLWSEDQVMVLDLRGADLRRLIETDTRGELVVSGMDPARFRVMGRRIDPDVHYRVATTDVLVEGSRTDLFRQARRVRRHFRITEEGGLTAGGSETVALRDFILSELHRIRALGKGDEYLDRIAARVSPDPPYENLLLFAFERPTLWSSLNRTYSRGSYGSVPESRVTSTNAWVIGASGRLKATYDRSRFAADLGVTAAYSRQSASVEGGGSRVSESADDFKVDVTFRRKGVEGGHRVQPFVRGLFDTEFSRTVNPVSGASNPRQLALRGAVGLTRPPTPTWRVAELAGVVENDFGAPHAVFGLQARTEARWPLAAGGSVLYIFRNDATYFLPSPRDTEADLALRYNMVHELIIPLVEELALSVGADLFFFQGKVEATRRPGASMLLRVGLTYDRIWKPRYQPLF